MKIRGKGFIQLTAIAALILAASLPGMAQKEFSNWPAGTSPQEVGKRVAERYVAGPHTNFGRPTPPPSITYPEVMEGGGVGRPKFVCGPAT